MVWYRVLAIGLHTPVGIVCFLLLCVIQESRKTKLGRTVNQTIWNWSGMEQGAEMKLEELELDGTGTGGTRL